MTNSQFHSVMVKAKYFIWLLLNQILFPPELSHGRQWFIMLVLLFKWELARTPSHTWESQLHWASSTVWQQARQQGNPGCVPELPFNSVVVGNGPHGVKAACYLPHLVPFSSPKARTAGWFESRILTGTRAWSLGPKVTHSASLFSSRSVLQV